MNESRCLLTVLLVVGISSTAPAAEVMFARSNGDFQARAAPGKYSALNILDGNTATVWCSEGSGQNAVIEVLFDEPIYMEKMDISMGNQSSANTFSAYNRIKSLQIFGGVMSHPFDLEDRKGRQTLRFDPAIETDNLMIKLMAGYRGDRSRHTCISDAIFYRGNRALNGPKLKKTIRKARNKLTFLDSWVAGPEMNKTNLLAFGLNDRYRLHYVPLDPTEGSVRKKGAWRLVGGNPEIKVDRKWVPVSVKRDDAGRVLRLKLKGLGLLDGVYIRRSEAPAH